MTMKGSKLALLLLLVVALEILLFIGSDAKPWLWRRRRRRRTCNSYPPPHGYVNKWRQQLFSFKCPDSYDSISVWESEHLACVGDRIHRFQCKHGPFRYQPKHCSSTHYANDYDRALTFRCPPNGVITGVDSIFSASKRDRRFSFRCCHRYGYIAHTCQQTAIKNSFGKPLRYEVPDGYYLVGAFSEYRNSKQDRIWRFHICTFQTDSRFKPQMEAAGNKH
ncbi:PREDICTED: dermatopontin-like [Acropora digitifera]|uniref:dermatopontin-like n=1 Tax=Acropora digitifera TaxID=70779 RepID=UPI00077A3E50|nr:PREDICTED: dermatopontin-like [Acropora digitifera]XP_015750310.1 PREDICTED: dermatopontin-like [Acropora digitifera]XP_015750316.1 PREDICTED: dermatopontin-like [Acropora digitifera]XP_015750323.1 PREDICTED: dermatopontin-like [Acropora digitifera]